MKAKNEFELQWKAYNNGKSKNIVKIIDVYKQNLDGYKFYAVVMEL